MNSDKVQQRCGDTELGPALDTEVDRFPAQGGQTAGKVWRQLRFDQEVECCEMERGHLPHMREIAEVEGARYQCDVDASGFDLFEGVRYPRRFNNAPSDAACQGFRKDRACGS